MAPEPNPFSLGTVFIKKILMMQELRWLLAVFILALFSCSMESDSLGVFDLNEGEVQMHYYETQCADPWYETENTEPVYDVNNKISRMVSYLEQQGIEVLAVSYEFNQDEALACLACECQTGGIYYVKIKYDEAAVEKMTELGFLTQ
jgi:hypothetical protein